MSVVDLPPGLGLVGTPLATFVAPRGQRRFAILGLVLTAILLAATWYFLWSAYRQYGYRRNASTIFILPIAFVLFTTLALAIRSARVAITRDGIRWGWTALGFTQTRARIAMAHVYADGIAIEATRGSKWFLAARDWERFDVLVRQLRRAELPLTEYPRKAPLRERMQSYGRFLDLLIAGSVVAALAVATWAS